MNKILMFHDLFWTVLTNIVFDVEIGNIHFLENNRIIVIFIYRKKWKLF